MTAKTRVRPPSSGVEAAPEAPPDPVSEAARVLALHRWAKPYGHCVGQLVFALALEAGDFTSDPEEER